MMQAMRLMKFTASCQCHQESFILETTNYRIGKQMKMDSRMKDTTTLFEIYDMDTDTTLISMT